MIAGPSGTGKTRLIKTVLEQCAEAHPEKSIIVTSQNNTAVHNVAEALVKSAVLFVIFVSWNYYKWYSESYAHLKDHVCITGNSSDRVKTINKEGGDKYLSTALVFFATMDSVNSKSVIDALSTRAVDLAIIDESSQIRHEQLLTLSLTLGPGLKVVELIGDGKQLPPHGQGSFSTSDAVSVESPFDVDCLSRAAAFLEEQWRCPFEVADFISKEIYEGNLVTAATKYGLEMPIAFIDGTANSVSGRVQLDQSSQNEFEAKIVIASPRILCLASSADPNCAAAAYANLSLLLESAAKFLPVLRITLRTIQGRIRTGPDISFQNTFSCIHQSLEELV